MEIELYLKDISQDIIGQNYEFARRTAGSGCIYFCCDAFCCIADFKSHQWANYVKDPVEKERLTSRLVLRGEQFGGLLWNTTTKRVFKLDKEAYNLFMDLEKSEAIEPVLEKYNLTEAELKNILKKVGKATEKC